MTNNVVESFNSLVAKYIGGKRINRYRLQNNIHSRLMNASPREFTKRYSKSLEKKALKKKSQQDFPSLSKRKCLQFEGPDKHYRQKDLDREIQAIEEEAMKAFLSSLSMDKAALEKLEIETRE
ncbi:hypothetical protein J437_LFUL016732 [Ladona fulva]|uniref:Uncharacterized protein n=1 Tax=Ladona fulva TaxID=123851 RepID=A0A8K0KKV0_LADFU|nr:hypothetical protein J437_LFUL016732 [Ladona fulva]